MTAEVKGTRSSLEETAQFVERALVDFGLMEEFESRPSHERAECLIWIDAAPGERAQECRVSRLLDDLALGQPLRRLGTAQATPMK